MSYKPIHNYRRKDRLPVDDPEKIIYGSHLSDDFEAIARVLSAIQEGAVGFPETPDGGEVTFSAEWGQITGDISQQTDLQSALNSKLNKADLDVIRGGTY